MIVYKQTTLIPCALLLLVNSTNIYNQFILVFYSINIYFKTIIHKRLCYIFTIFPLLFEIC